MKLLLFSFVFLLPTGSFGVQILSENGPFRIVNLEEWEGRKISMFFISGKGVFNVSGNHPDVYVVMDYPQTVEVQKGGVANFARQPFMIPEEAGNWPFNMIVFAVHRKRQDEVYFYRNAEAASDEGHHMPPEKRYPTYDPRVQDGDWDGRDFRQPAKLFAVTTLKVDLDNFVDGDGFCLKPVGNRVVPCNR